MVENVSGLTSLSSLRLVLVPSSGNCGSLQTKKRIFELLKLELSPGCTSPFRTSPFRISLPLSVALNPNPKSLTP